MVFRLELDRRISYNPTRNHGVTENEYQLG